MVKSAENPPPPRCQEEPHLLQVLGDLKDGTVSKVWTQEIGWFRTQNVSQHRKKPVQFPFNPFLDEYANPRFAVPVS